MSATIHAGIPLDEVLPASLNHVSGVSTSTAMASRKRLRLVPQSGSTANPGDTIGFLIQDGNFLDLRSAVLHATIKVSGTIGTGNQCLDDGVAWLNTFNASVDGQNLESVSRVNKLTNMETYMSCSKSLYDRALSFAGFWKYNPELRPATTAGMAAANWADIGLNSLSPSAFCASAKGYDVAVPLGLVSHVFRSEKLFPSRFCANLNLQFTLESALVALFSTGNSAPTSYQLTNVYLEVDSVTLNPSFVAHLQDMVMDSAGSGLVLPFNTKVSSLGQASPNGGEVSIVASRASRNLKRVAVVQQPTAALAAGATTYPQISTFPCAGFSDKGSVQLSIGGMPYPQYPQQGSAAFFGALAAYNGSVFSDTMSCIPNYRTWYNTTQVDGSATGAGNTIFSDSWIWAFDLSKLTGTSDPLEDDGINTTGSSIVNLNIRTGAKENVGAAESYTALVELLGTKFLTISQGQVKIQG